MSVQCLFGAIKAKVGNPYRKLILIVLADIANDENKCWPSHDYLAERTECKRRAVIEHLGALEAAGFISVERRYSDDGQQKTNMYTINTCGVHEKHTGVHETAKGGAPDAHNTPIDTPIFINSEAWEEWIEYRRQSKKKMTPATVKKQHGLLSQYSKPIQQQIINNSIQNGWAGLFPPKEQGNGANRPGGYTGQNRQSKSDDIRSETFSDNW